MSHSILIKYRPGIPTKELPLATNNSYQEEWLPIIDELKLDILKQAIYGINISKDELPELKTELNKILQFLGGRNSTMSERISFLISAIANINPQDIYGIYVG
jgi:hypothetical protein